MLPPPNAGPVSSHLGSPAPQPGAGREPREVLLPKSAVTVPEYKAHRLTEFATACCGEQTFRPLFRPPLSDSFGAETGQFWGSLEGKTGGDIGFLVVRVPFLPLLCRSSLPLARKLPSPRQLSRGGAAGAGDQSRIAGPARRTRPPGQRHDTQPQHLV